MKTQVSHAAGFWALRAHRGTFAFFLEKLLNVIIKAETLKMNFEFVTSLTMGLFYSFNHGIKP